MDDEDLEVSGLELWQWRQVAQKQAIDADIPLAEVDWLLQTLTGIDRLALRLESFKDRTAIDLQLPLNRLTQLWQQRLEARVPLQYLVGVAPWRQFTLQVSPAVLIPRPETELLIDLAAGVAQRHPDLAQGNWADLGTGSGAIALGLADAFFGAKVHAVDRSLAALSIAQANARQWGFADRIRFYHGSWFQPLDLKQKLSGMVSNPPYIPSGRVPNLQPEVAQHEPHVALDGGADGLDCVRHLVKTAPTYLKSGGIWLVEIMAGQAAIVAELLHQQGDYGDIQIHADLARIDRFVLAYRR